MKTPVGQEDLDKGKIKMSSVRKDSKRRVKDVDIPKEDSGR
jgi:hypothetical protein